MRNRGKLTKKYHILYIIFAILSFTSFIGPSAYFFTDAFIRSNMTVQKVTLVSTLVVVLILTAIAIVNKIALRSRMWIVVLGLFLVMKNFIPVLIAIGVGQILHELIFDPIKNYYKNKYKIHKEIDKREIHE